MDHYSGHPRLTHTNIYLDTPLDGLAEYSLLYVTIGLLFAFYPRLTLSLDGSADTVNIAVPSAI